MADASYNDFINAAQIEPLVLVEIEPKQEFVGWEEVFHPSRRPSFAFAYQVIVPPFVSTDKTPGGMLADITAVRANGVALTEVDTPWAVEDTPNSFFYNVFGVSDLPGSILGEAILGEAILGVNSSNLFDANALMVHITNDDGDFVDPSTLDAVVVFRKMYFATKAVVYNDRLYEPRVDASTEISMKEVTDDVMFGSSKAVGSGSVKLLNGDGVFDKLFGTMIWNNANVTVRFGGTGLTFNQLQTIGTYKIEADPVFDFNSIELNIRDEQKLTEQKIPRNVFDILDYPLMDTAQAGSPIPLLIGQKTGIKPVAVGDTTDVHIYMISDPDEGGVYSVDAVYLVDTNGKVTDSISVTGPYIQTTLTGGTFAILPTFSGNQVPSNSNVRVNAKGVPAQGDDWETSTDYLKFYGEIVGWIFTSLLGLDAERFDSDAALTVDDDFSYEHGIWINSVQQAKVLVRKFETGVLGRTIRTLDGLITPTVFSPETDFTNVVSLHDVDIMEFQPAQELESGKIFSTVRVLYDEDPITDETRFEEVSDPRTKYFYLDEIDEVRILETALRTANHAANLAQRCRFISRLPTLRVTIPETGVILMNANLTDRVQVTVARGPDASGAWSGKLMEIDMIERTLAPVPKVVVAMNDLLGIGSTASRWVESDHPDYDNSTESERTRAGFWSDEDGFVDPSVAGTRGIKLWF